MLPARRAAFSRRDAHPRQKAAGDDRHARAGIKQRNALRLLYADMDEQQVFKAAVRETIRHTFFFPFCYGAYACMASCSVMTVQPFFSQYASISGISSPLWVPDLNVLVPTDRLLCWM